jgi:hypothetical protein
MVCDGFDGILAAAAGAFESGAGDVPQAARVAAPAAAAVRKPKFLLLKAFTCCSFSPACRYPSQLHIVIKSND